METLEKPEETVETSPRVSGTVNWRTSTLIGVFAGMLYGGSKEAAKSVSKDAAMEKRFVRVTRGSIIGGAGLGMFTAAFFGIQNMLAGQRGVHDVYNVVGAGSATAAMFRLILPGSLQQRLRNVLLGSVLGAAFGFPLGWLHLKLVEQANEENTLSHSSTDGSEEKDKVDSGVEKVEGNSAK